jgi:arsenate reductase-like glutaredoxin family protein
MRFIVFILFLMLSTFVFSQNIKPQKVDSWWDQGVPTMPDNPYIMGLIYQLGDTLDKWDFVTTQSKAKMCREIGLAFYDRGMYDAADWYLVRSKNYREEVKIEKDQSKILEKEVKSLEKDKIFLEKLPVSFESMSRSDLKKLVSQVDEQIKKLLRERDSLIKEKAPQIVIDSKNQTIKSLKKERDFIKMNIKNYNLLDEIKKIKNYVFWLIIGIITLILAIVALLQRNTIKYKDKKIVSQLKEIGKKNTYLEHAARIIRHDMHSGINTYIPKGISTLEKRLSSDDIKNLKIELPIKMIKEGLNHTQRVYKSVYEFTNLVKQNVVLEKVKVDVKESLYRYLLSTSYKSLVMIDNLGELEVNETLFCNAIDNLIRNGLKYNDNEDKFVRIYKEDNKLIIQDNGRGMTQKQFNEISTAYLKNKNKDIDKGVSGLGLNICITILEEHGFKLSCEKNEIGTKMIINLK